MGLSVCCFLDRGRDTPELGLMLDFTWDGVTETSKAVNTHPNIIGLGQSLIFSSLCVKHQ